MNCLEHDETESYQKRCGEIFLTSKENITIHCTLCEMIYKNFDAYAGHLFEQHLKSAKTLEDNLSLEKSDNCDVGDNLSTEAEDIVSLIKVEIETLENDFLKEEELPIDTLLEDSKTTDNEEKDFLSNFENNYLRKIVECTEIELPGEIRNVNKRTLRGPTIAPEEERKHKCPICGAGFKEKNNMKYHFKRHSTEKNHECPECHKKFYTNAEVRVHMRFHTRERNYLCNHCGQSFLRGSHLASHIKRHTNQRDFKCEKCNKAFFEGETLKRHMNGHSSERPFACKNCPAKFSRKTALRNHEKLHENKREYKCSLCGMGFNQQAGLFSHMKVTHKIT